MAQIVTLVPNDGTELELTDPFVLLSAEWGDTDVDAHVATGVDVRGAVPGPHQTPPVTRTLSIGVNEYTGTDYLASLTLLDRAIADMQNGGKIRVQQSFADGISEALETPCLEAHPSDLDSTRRHKGWSQVTVAFLTQPYWLVPDLEQLATVAASTDSVATLTIPQPRGNLWSPALLRMEDNASTARRFAEVGGTFVMDDPRTIEYRAADFDLTDTEASLTGAGSDSLAISGRAVVLDDLAPVWRVMAYLPSLAHKGTYHVDLRGKGSTDNATALIRVSWRVGTGQWREAGTVQAKADYWDLDVGVIPNYLEGDTMDLRIDVRGTDIDTAASTRLDTLTLMPAAEVYCVARGKPVVAGIEGVAIFDDFNHDSGSSLGGTTAPIAPGGSSTWIEAGDTGLDWTISPAEAKVYRTLTVADDAVLPAAGAGAPQKVGGQFQVIGAATMTDTTVSADEVKVFNTSRTSTEETRAGIVARYVNPGNCLMLVNRRKRRSNGFLKEVALYKLISPSWPTGTTTVTKLWAADAWGLLGWPQDEGDPRVFSFSVNAAGDVTLGLGAQVVTADADLASGGALNDGKVGIYMAADHTDGVSASITNFRASANAPATVYVDVVRDGGIGEIDGEAARTTDADGSNPQPISDLEGRRLWIPPNAGAISVKLRTSDSRGEADAGAGLSTDLTLLHQPAFASLSDAEV